VHQLSDIVAALPHSHEPLLRNGPQLGRAIGKPDVDSRVPSCASGDAEDVALADQPAEVQGNATGFMSGHDNVEIQRHQSTMKSFAPTFV
jgi:hypothetical protein